MNPGNYAAWKTSIPKVTYVVGFQLYNISEGQNFKNGEWFTGEGEEEGRYGHKRGTLRVLCGDITVLYLGRYINLHMW